MFLAGIRPSSVHNSAVPCSRYVPENSFKERKMVAVFNSLLVHPQATAASIEAELNSLNTLQGIHFDGWDNGGHDSIVCASSLHFQAGSIVPRQPSNHQSTQFSGDSSLPRKLDVDHFTSPALRPRRHSIIPPQKHFRMLG